MGAAHAATVLELREKTEHRQSQGKACKAVGRSPKTKSLTVCLLLFAAGERALTREHLASTTRAHATTETVTAAVLEGASADIGLHGCLFLRGRGAWRVIQATQGSATRVAGPS